MSEFVYVSGKNAKLSVGDVSSACSSRLQRVHGGVVAAVKSFSLTAL